MAPRAVAKTHPCRLVSWLQMVMGLMQLVQERVVEVVSVEEVEVEAQQMEARPWCHQAQEGQVEPFLEDLGQVQVVPLMVEVALELSQPGRPSLLVLLEVLQALAGCLQVAKATEALDGVELGVVLVWVEVDSVECCSAVVTDLVEVVSLELTARVVAAKALEL